MQPESEHGSVTPSEIDTFDEDRSAVLELVGRFVDVIDLDVDMAFADDVVDHRLERVKEAVRPLQDAAKPTTLYPYIERLREPQRAPAPLDGAIIAHS